MNRIKEFFDQESSRYDKLYNPDPTRYPVATIRMQHMINLLCEYVLRGHILDIGCGTGFVSKLIAFMGHKVDGIDVSSAMIDRASGLGIEEAQFWVDDIETTDILNESYDGVVVLGVLEYLDSDDCAMKQIYRILRPGGVIVATWPNRLFNLFSLNQYTIDEVEKGPYLTLLSEFMSDVKHIKSVTKHMTPPIDVRQSTPRQVRHLMNIHHFEILRLRYFHFHPYPPIFESLDPVNYNKTGQEMEQFGYSPIGACMASCFMVAARKV